VALSPGPAWTTGAATAHPIETMTTDPTHIRSFFIPSFYRATMAE